ncbi:MAG: DUF1285 domain-containing protein [Pseudomonadales bacterium]
MSKEYERLLGIAREQTLPPVASWDPDRVGEIDIRIRADGVWFHEGTEIKRRAISRLFSTILRREDDGYYLVTPVEKLRIVVDDVPFMAIAMEVEGAGRDQSLLFTTNCDDHVIAGKDHPLRVGFSNTGPKPYLLVREGLEALIARSVYYRLVERVEDEDADELCVWSEGARFVLGNAKTGDA